MVDAIRKGAAGGAAAPGPKQLVIPDLGILKLLAENRFAWMPAKTS